VITTQLFSSSDAEVPFASSALFFETPPEVDDEVVLKPASAGWSGNQPVARVTSVERLDGADWKVTLLADMPDSDLHQSAVLDGWNRHRRAKD